MLKKELKFYYFCWFKCGIWSICWISIVKNETSCGRFEQLVVAAVFVCCEFALTTDRAAFTLIRRSIGLNIEWQTKPFLAKLQVLRILGTTSLSSQSDDTRILLLVKFWTFSSASVTVQYQSCSHYNCIYSFQLSILNEKLTFWFLLDKRCSQNESHVDSSHHKFESDHLQHRCH